MSNRANPRAPTEPHVSDTMQVKGINGPALVGTWACAGCVVIEVDDGKVLDVHLSLEKAREFQRQLHVMIDLAETWEKEERA